MLVPKGHPLAKVRPLTLEALARYPIVTYDFSFTGRSQINAAFAAKGLEPNVVLTALDSDVIKTYVELGMGVGIVAQMAYDPARDTQFEKLDAAPSFRRQHDPPRAAPRRLPARLRLRVHRAVRAAVRPRPRSTRPCRAKRKAMSCESSGNWSSDARSEPRPRR